jgi:hypothetical protein
MEENQNLIRPTNSEQADTQASPPPTNISSPESTPQYTNPVPVSASTPPVAEPDPISQAEPVRFNGEIPQIAAISSEADLISWSAPEFIEHKKSSKWFATFGVVVIVVAIAIYFIVHSIFAIVMIALIGIAFGVIAGRHPRIINYELSVQGVRIGRRFNSYDQFKSYSVIDEPGLGSVVFNPFKRFAFPTTIYYDLDDEDKIEAMLVNRLPHTEAPNDPVEQLMRRFRF